ncbi:J domain-containing protein [Paenarthrobacter sp. Z7-10]|uniref:J domain-containing protein n=1 Tax=Paenarthrobacter sp. Z7-10 TaxID=2787635 RepID=UPI0022A8FFFB|nr:DnaJ domain-containing protein [Paenarthrobacter sp. Z7-10]MCZ2402750.1 J domain-containing protein [Paenarthrobacter sp. Z7-10]
MSDPILTHYQVLGIAVTATERDIKTAYRKAARHAHPDHGGDAEAFRMVTAAYETLMDPQRRAAYDKSYGAGSRAQPAWFAPSSSAGFGSPNGSSASESFNVSTSAREQKVSARDDAVFVPAYADVPAGAQPLLPLARAAQQVHGAPRKRGLFGAQARLQREARTIQLLMQQVLPDIPSARLINGLVSPADNSYIDHALLTGYRLVLIGSMLLPEGAYRWNGGTLVHGAKVLEPPRMLPAVRRMQELFPECNVTGWICVHSPGGNLYEPVIDYARGSEPDGSDLVHVLNGSRLIRDVKHFLAAGPTPNVVDLSVLSRLLGGMY